MTGEEVGNYLAGDMMQAMDSTFLRAPNCVCVILKQVKNKKDLYLSFICLKCRMYL